MTISRWLWSGLAPALLFAQACGSAQREPAAPARGPDVVIPEVKEDDAKTADKGPPAPVGARDPIPSEVDPGYGEGDPGAGDDMWGGYSSGPRGGVDCDRAADCCLKMYQQTSDPSIQRVCGSIRNAPASLCSNMLTSFQQAAPTMGISCP